MKILRCRYWSYYLLRLQHTSVVHNASVKSPNNPNKNTENFVIHPQHTAIFHFSVHSLWIRFNIAFFFKPLTTYLAFVILPFSIIFSVTTQRVDINVWLSIRISSKTPNFYQFSSSASLAHLTFSSSCLDMNITLTTFTSFYYHNYATHQHLSQNLPNGISLFSSWIFK